MSYTAHKAAARDTPVRCAVLTVSDTRTPETDQSGALIKARLAETGHEVVHYRVCPDEPDTITSMVFREGRSIIASRQASSAEREAGGTADSLPGAAEPMPSFSAICGADACCCYWTISSI